MIDFYRDYGIGMEYAIILAVVKLFGTEQRIGDIEMPLNKQANRRLWINYKNDHVQITLIPGKELRIIEYESTDEGYYFQNRRYYLSSDDNIYVNSVSFESDCAGYIERKYAFHITPEGDKILVSRGISHYADVEIYNLQAQQAGY